MIKVCIEFCLLFVVFLLLYIAYYCVAIFWMNWSGRKLKNDRVEQALFSKWCQARHDRECWKQNHLEFFNFDDPEYQKLWMIEIGAEDLFFLKLRKGLSWLKISWSGYNVEKNEYERAQ